MTIGPAPVSTRVLSPNDWRLFRRLRLEALREAPYAFGTALRDWQGERDLEARWRTRLTDVPFNVAAYLDNAPVGIVSGTKPDGEGAIELISMWVAPHARGRGVGTTSVGAVLDWARKQRFKSVWLDVREDNERAIALYRRGGFVDRGRIDGPEPFERRMLHTVAHAEGALTRSGYTEFIGGVEPAVIILAEYDPAWPLRFERERSRIANALGVTAKEIDHIGSTAVPGLAAKPVIDICVVVDDVEDERAFVPDLQSAGYVLRVREPGHRMFRTPSKDVHVHIWSDRAEIERHIAFRDCLRANESGRRRYERVKRVLAKRDWNDSNDYAEAKSEIIAEIIATTPAPYCTVLRNRPDDARIPKEALPQVAFGTRPAQARDWRFIEALYSRSHVVGQLHAPSEASFGHSLERQGFYNVIICRDDVEFGNLVFDVDSGWLVNARALAMWERRSGGGRFAMEHLISYAFKTLRARRIFLEILESNAASRRLCEAVGFRQEGMYRDGYRDETEGFHNLVPYALLLGDLPPDKDDA